MDESKDYALFKIGVTSNEEEWDHLKLFLGSLINPTPECRRVFCPLAALSSLSGAALNPVLKAALSQSPESLNLSDRT